MPETEPSTSYKPADQAAQAAQAVPEQAIHEEVQHLAEPKAIKAEAASQEKVKQYADQLAEEYE